MLVSCIFISHKSVSFLVAFLPITLAALLVLLQPDQCLIRWTCGFSTFTGEEGR